MNYRLPRVKVCGLCRVQDLRAALAAGADAVGFVQHPPSPRAVAPDQVADMLAAVGSWGLDAARGLDAAGSGLDEASGASAVGLPSAGQRSAGEPLSVAVMVDLDPTRAHAWAARAGVAAVQLCGQEQAKDWSGFPLPLWRRIGVDGHGAEEMKRWHGVANAFVLDHPDSVGGSGRTVDWELAHQLVQRGPCLLAGGLGADNVVAAVAAALPAGVDASSRLEAAPGCKNPAEVLTFVQRAHAALDLIQQEAEQ